MVRDLYAPALAGLGWLERAMFVEPGASSASSFAEAFPAANLHRMDWREGLQRFGSQCDAVVVCLPTSLHAEAVRAAIAAGRSVLCEKPLTLDANTGRELCDLADAARVTLQVCLPRRFLPSMRAAKAWLDGGLLGAVRHVSIEDGGPYLWNPASDAPFRAESGGVLADMAPHFLDLARMFAGPMSPLRYSDDAAGGVEADCTFALRARDCDVELRLSRTSALADRILVTCERGAIEIARASLAACRVVAGEALVTQSQPASPFASGPWQPSLQACFAEVLFEFSRGVQSAAGGTASAREHLADLSCIEWAYSKRSPVASPRRPSHRKIVVTGGSGFIGTHVVERLHAAGERNVVVPVRRFGSAAEVARWPVRLVAWDWDKPDAFAAALDGTDTVFHLAFGRTREGRSVTVDGTLDLLSAARKANVRRCVILSTMWVYGFPHAAGLVDETFPMAPYGGEYAESKALMERRVLEYCREHARPEVVILNPTCVFGPRGGVYTRTPLELAREGRFCWVDGGEGIANYVYAGNVADAMLLAADAPGVHGERFIINDGAITWRELVSPFLGSLAGSVPSMSAQNLGAAQAVETSSTLSEIGMHLLRDSDLRRKVMRHPLLKRVAGAGKRIVPQLAARPATPGLVASAVANGNAAPPDWLATVFGPFTDRFSSEKARAKLGWRPAVALPAAQLATVEWLRKALRLE